jgi:hypothetical protein
MRHKLPPASWFFLIGVALVGLYFVKFIFGYALISAGRIQDSLNRQSQDVASLKQDAVIEMTIKPSIQLDSYIRSLRASASKRPVFDNLDFSSIASYTKSVEPYRRRLSKSIGFPPPFFDAYSKERVRMTHIAEDKLAVYYKLDIPTLPGFLATGFYIRPKKASLSKPLQLIIAASGRDGPPISTKDNLVPILARSDRNIAYCAINKGYAVWLPTFVHYGPGGLDDRWKLAMSALESGTSLPAIEIAGIIKAIDFFSQRSDIEVNSIAMMGHSYGGFYTLFTAVLDSRIKTAVVSAYFNSRSDVLDKWSVPEFSDWRFPDSLSLWQDTEVVALVAPRPLMIEAGIYDQLFDINGVRRAIPGAKLIYQRLGVSNHFSYQEMHARHDFSCDRATRFIANQTQ